MSRISLMTGVHRKDVTRIFREDDRDIREGASLTSRITNYWDQSEEFTTKAGKPRVLSLEGEDAEFKHLVWSVDRHMNPGAILFEMERMGIVERTPRGLKLLENVTRFEKDPSRGYELLSRDAQSLFEAVEENIFRLKPRKNLHIRTSYDNIFKQDIPRIEKWLFDEGAKFHAKCRKFLARFDKDVNPNPKKEGGAQVVITAFSHTLKESPETPSEE